MGVDWTEAHRRMKEAADALELVGKPPAEERRSILRRRALDLSRAEAAAGEEESIDVVEFRLASELYAVEYHFVREVYPLRYFAPLPGTPAFVLGIMNLRGQVLSIVDLRVFFGLPAKGLGELNKVIVLRDERMEFGILADEVLGVRALPRLGLQSSLPTLTDDKAGYLLGIADGGTAVIDAGRLLGDERIVVRDEAD